MSTVPRLLALLLDACAPADHAAVLARLTPHTRHTLLRRGGPPAPELAAWALDHGDPADLRALARNPALDRRLLDRLAAVAADRDPATAALVYAHPTAPFTLRRRILATAPGADVRALVLGSRTRRLLGPALDGPDPELAVHARTHVRGPHRRRPPNTPQALYAWLSDRPADTQHNRALQRGRLALFRTDLWTDRDWAELAALHHADPLDEATRTVLVAVPECPTAVALALLYTDDSDNSHGDSVLAGLAAGTFTAHDLVHRAPHASVLLRTLESLDRRDDDRPSLPPVRELRHELGVFVRKDIGTDPARWRALFAWLAAEDFPGTLPELAEAVRSRPAPPYEPRPWPHAQTYSWSPFVHLLCRAEPSAMPGILGALDPHDLGELAHYDIQQPLPDDLVEAFLDQLPHDSDDLLDLFLTHHGHHQETWTRVLRRDDPRAKAVLLGRNGVPSRVWYEVAAGHPHAPGRTAPLPPHPAALALLSGGHQVRGADVIRYAVHTGDPELIARALRHPQPTLTAAHQITGCRRLVGLGRADLLPELAHLHGPLDPLLATRLRTTPPPGDPALLADRLAALDRAQFVQDLRHGPLDAVRAQFENDRPPYWDAVRDLLRDRSLPVRARDVVAEHPDCPDDIAYTLLAEDHDHTAVPLALAVRSRAHALAALDRQPVVPDWMASRPGSVQVSLTWSLRCLRAGLLTTDDVYRHGRPARAVLLLLSLLPDEFAPVRGRLAAHPAVPPDAWAVAAALLDDFAGTLPELFATAAAAAGP